MTVSTETAEAVFAAAVTGHARRTNLGLRIAAMVDGYTYTVTIEEGYRAYCDVREGWGGTEFIDQVNATAVQHRALREAHAPQM